MKVLLDVNAGRAVADLLANLGHDVACVADRDPRMQDGTILDWAMRERRMEQGGRYVGIKHKSPSTAHCQIQ